MDSSDNRMGFWERYGKTLSVLVGLALCITSYCLVSYKIISSEQAWASTIEIVLAIIAGFGYEKASSLKQYREAAVIISKQKLEINTQDVKIKELNTNIDNKTTTILQQNTEIQNKTAEIKKLKTQIQELSQRGGNGATMLQANNGGINIFASPPGNAHLDKLREEGKKDRKERTWRLIKEGEYEYIKIISENAPLDALYAYKSSEFIDEDDKRKYELLVLTQKNGWVKHPGTKGGSDMGSTYWYIYVLTIAATGEFLAIEPTLKKEEEVSPSTKAELSALLTAVAS